jgi:hypothetical protein
MNHRRFAVFLEARISRTVFLAPLVMHDLSSLGRPALYGLGSGQVRSCAPSYDLSSGHVRSSVKKYDPEVRSRSTRQVRPDLATALGSGQRCQRTREPTMLLYIQLECIILSLEQVLISSCMRTEDKMTDVFGNPLIHESAQFSYLYHATAHRHGSDQSDREPTMAMHCLDILDYVIFESGFL